MITFYAAVGCYRIKTEDGPAENLMCLKAVLTEATAEKAEMSYSRLTAT